MKDPFAKHLPSVFVVCSPFQVLCMIAAIRQLEIEKYKIIAIFPKGEDHRNTQVKHLLESYKLPYTSVHRFLNRLTFNLVKVINLIPRSYGYKRLFVGDYRNILEYNLGILFVSDSADVVFLDDGNATINLLNDSARISWSSLNRWWLKYINEVRHLSHLQNLLTIYKDIENKRYNTMPLELDLVIGKDSKKQLEPNGVYIIGTNLSNFCMPKGMTDDFFIKKLGDLMHDLKLNYPEDTIYFMAHGREQLDYGEQLCKEYECVFKRPEMMVEMEILNMGNPPKAVYGYTSTALYNLKMIYPSSKIVNIVFEDSSASSAYGAISEFYYKNGIELVKKHYPEH